MNKNIMSSYAPSFVVFMLLLFMQSAWAVEVQMNGDVAVSGTVNASSFSGSFSGSGVGITNIPGTAITTTSITVNQLADNAVTVDKLHDDAVTPAKIAFFSKIAIVAASGGDYTNPATAMGDFSNWCGVPSATNSCLLKIMPGVYAVSSSVVMQPYIDIEGSGENTTIIQGTVDSLTSGVVSGASNAEIRFLTVKNNGGGTYAVAVYNTSASPKITNVTVSASGGSTSNIGVYNVSSSSPTMTNVTSNTTGGSFSTGVFNDFSSPALTNMTIIATGGSTNSGVRCRDSSPTMTNVAITSSGGSLNNFGVYTYTQSPGTGGTTRINHSVISGATAIANGALGVNTYVGNTQLLGTVSNAGGTLTCVGAYNTNYSALGTNCLP